MLRLTGANGVMIGRAAIKSPWVFWQIKNNTNQIPQVLLQNLVLEHFDKMVEFYGERGVIMFRKNLHAYSKGKPNAHEFRNTINSMTNPSQARQEIEEFFGDA